MLNNQVTPPKYTPMFTVVEHPPEEKLSIQVRQINRIHINDIDSTKAHQSLPQKFNKRNIRMVHM